MIFVLLNVVVVWRVMLFLEFLELIFVLCLRNRLVIFILLKVEVRWRGVFFLLFLVFKFIFCLISI